MLYRKLARISGNVTRRSLIRGTRALGTSPSGLRFLAANRQMSRVTGVFEKVAAQWKGIRLISEVGSKALIKQ